MALELRHSSGSPRRLVRAQIAGPIPRVSESLGLEMVGESVVLTSSQELLGPPVLQVWGPHFESQRFKEY